MEETKEIFSPKPKVPRKKVTMPELVTMALDKLKDSVENNKPSETYITDPGTGGDNARYGAVIKVGSNYTTEVKQYPCHAYMKHYRNAKVVHNQYRHRNLVPYEVDRTYFDWITGDKSPWYQFFNRNISHTPDSLDKQISDVDWIFNNGWVWSDLSYPSNLQHNFLVASRMPAEWPSLINLWYTWTERGIDKALAFVFLTVFTKLVNYDKFQINRTNKYDWPLDTGSSGEEYIKNFLSGHVEALTKPYKDDPRYVPVNRIFGDNSANPSQAYPNQLFSMYADPSKEQECHSFWINKGIGFSGFDYKTHWTVSEEELLDIMKSEQKRLIG